ncbi:MAG: hypothetical protein HYZ54_10460 [Ignavibacteriae bacterium]|nr:hypothetical protein [Ignavibacteriota bacterium]
MTKFIYTITILLMVNFVSIFAAKDIVNKLTPKHIAITGSRVSLIPPIGFKKSTNFLGLQHQTNGSTIMIVQLPEPFSEVSKGFTKEEVLSKGLAVSVMENYTLNNLPAIYMAGIQKANGAVFTRYVLVFGTAEESIMINGTFPEKLVEIGKEIKKSIFSTYYESNKKVDPLSTVDFEINPVVANLKFANTMMSSLVYTRDGKFPPSSNDKTSLIAGKSISTVNVEDRKLYTLNRLKQFPLENLKIESTTEVKIDGISGYETTAICNEKGAEELTKIEYVILFTDKSYYVFLGTTNVDFGSNIGNLRQAIRTFKRK